MEYPFIDPILLSIGPLKIRWYGIAYIIGILGGYYYLKSVLECIEPKFPIRPHHINEALTWIIIGIVVGGRLGHVLFYDLSYFLAHPFQIINTLQGGMSFHGGLMGVITATWIYAQRHCLSPWSLSDCLAIATPIGLFFGRVANFINGELYGIPTDKPWGIVFPLGGNVKRHPSQLYEAFLEGFVLWGILYFFMRKGGLWFKGRLGGIFLTGYGTARFLVEFVREPDSHIGYLIAGTTWGQWLSLPMIMLGIYLIKRAKPLPSHQR